MGTREKKSRLKKEREAIKKAVVHEDHTEKKKRRKINNELYEKELAALQVELVKLQEWVKYKGLKVVAIFEGRDAAGKGGVIKRIIERLTQSARLPRRGLRHADRTRKDPVVLPALCGTLAGGRRDRSVRPQLVQPGRRRTGHAFLHG